MATDIELEDCDGDDVPMIPLREVRCCFEWVNGAQVFYPLEVDTYGNDNIKGMRCPKCGGWYL